MQAMWLRRRKNAYKSAMKLLDKSLIRRDEAMFVRAIAQGANINAPVTGDYTYFSSAFDQGFWFAVRQVLDGGKVDTGIHSDFLKYKSDHIPIVLIPVFKKAGFDFAAHNYDVLYDAAVTGDEERVRAVLAAGVDPLKKVYSGKTALEALRDTGECSADILQYLRWQCREPDTGFNLAGDHCVVKVTHDWELARKLTEIFNFEQRIYRAYCENMRTNAESAVTAHFDDLSPSSLLEEAADFYRSKRGASLPAKNALKQRKGGA